MLSACQYHIDNRIIVMTSCSNSFVCILRERDGIMTRSRVKYRACPTHLVTLAVISRSCNALCISTYISFANIVHKKNQRNAILWLHQAGKECTTPSPIRLGSSLINLVWWRYDMKTVSASLAFCEGNHAVTSTSSLQRYSKSDIIWTKNRVIGDLRRQPPPPPCVTNRSENKIKK